MAKIMVDEGGSVLGVGDPDRFRDVERRLRVLVEEDEAMDAEDILTQAEEANAMDPVG